MSRLVFVEDPTELCRNVSMHLGMTWGRADLHYLQAREGCVRFAFSGDCRAAILTGGEIVFARCRLICDFVHVCVITALCVSEQVHGVICC